MKLAGSHFIDEEMEACLSSSPWICHIKMTSRFKRRAVQLGRSCLSLSLLGGCWLCCGSEGVAGVSKGDNSLFLEWKKD